MKETLQKSLKGRMMIGQAGVFRVASRLLLGGHVPSFPSVDTGVDILLDNGLRLQVKCCHIRQHRGFPFGAYCFSVKENNRTNHRRDWTKVCDYLVFWGIEEDRFFIIPASEAVQNFWVQPKVSNRISKVSRLTCFEDKWSQLDVSGVLGEIESQEQSFAVRE